MLRRAKRIVRRQGAEALETTPANLRLFGPGLCLGLADQAPVVWDAARPVPG